MKIRPLYDRVVIKRVEEKGDALRGGLYIPDSAKEKPQEGEVMAIGKGKAPGRRQAGRARRAGRRPHPFREIFRQRHHALKGQST